MNSITFLKNFIFRPVSVGAIAPSSPALAREMTRNLGIETADVVAELGPGTGAITPFVLEKKREEAAFFAVELNPEFHRILSERFPDETLLLDNIANLDAILKRLGYEQLDAVVCSLPWAAFPRELQITLLGRIHEALSPGARFATFAYLQGLLLPAGRRFRRLIGQTFDQVETSRVVWRNLPPAVVYRCSRAGQRPDSKA